MSGQINSAELINYINSKTLCAKETGQPVVTNGRCPGGGGGGGTPLFCQDGYVPLNRITFSGRRVLSRTCNFTI